MARRIPDISKHPKAMDKRGQKIVELLSKQITFTGRSPAKFYLHQADFAHIESLMKGSGFDVGRGFRCAGVTVLAFTPD